MQFVRVLFGRHSHNTLDPVFLNGLEVACGHSGTRPTPLTLPRCEVQAMRVVIVSHMLSGTAEYSMCMQIFLDWCLTFTRSVEQRQRGVCRCPCAWIPREVWRVGWLGGGEGLCRIIGLILALIVLVCELARHLQW